MAVDQSWFARLDRAATSAGYVFVGARWDGNARMLSASMRYGAVVYNLSVIDVLLDPALSNMHPLPHGHCINELEIQIERIRVLR